MKKWLIGLMLLALLATGMVSLAQDEPVFCGAFCQRLTAPVAGIGSRHAGCPRQQF